MENRVLTFYSYKPNFADTDQIPPAVYNWIECKNLMICFERLLYEINHISTISDIFILDFLVLWFSIRWYGLMNKHWNNIDTNTR